MDDFGSYSLWSDTPDVGSAFDFGGDFDLGGSFMPSYDTGGMGFGGSGLDTSWLDSYMQPQGGAGMYGGFQQGPLGIPQPQGAMGGGAAGQANPWIGGILGALGPLAGLAGAISGGGQTGQVTQGPRPTPQQNQAMSAGLSMGQQFASGQNPLQQQQASLLQALASGQGLPPGYAQLIEQAFEPQLGSLYQQAARAGRARGFHDAPGQSPAGGAILGPGLADLQGQMASAKLGLMHSLPQLYNQPVATQGNFAGNYLRGAQSMPMQTQQNQSQPMGPTIANSVGNILSGASQGYNAAQAQNQQGNTLNSLLQALQGGQKGGLSYT